MFMGCPLTWFYKLKSQIYLSTMEAEYIVLSQSMCEIIGIREVIKEIQFFFHFWENSESKILHSLQGICP